METKDPALTKTRIDGLDAVPQEPNASPIDHHNHHDSDIAGNTLDTKGTETFQETVIGSGYLEDDDIEDTTNVNNTAINKSADNKSTETFQESMIGSEIFHDADSNIEDDTTINKGTDTFEEGVVHSEHVNDGDNPARQPDRRDQQGSPFDENINEDTVGSEEPKSEELNDMNRYANVDNAQTRILNPDEKD
ncbi:hypothetical protein [Psychrobacter sp. CAL346-MNA-CIBAN-0220]|uniref:hypothetical protein n=1 Tax=Psychrobacter sp. CAL346-MNA-CIBAN-0220 TaxID=3140457 RepID=UPI00332E2898